MFKSENDIMKVGMNDTIQMIKQLENAIIRSNTEMATEIKDKGLSIVRLNAETMVNADETMMENKKQFATDYNDGRVLRTGIVTEVSIINTSQEATYIEYGTGMVGKSSPHPNPSSSWEYYVDTEHKRKLSSDLKGWFHKSKESDNKFWIGNESQPFMWQSKLDIQKSMKKWFARLLRKNMKGGVK